MSTKRKVIYVVYYSVNELDHIKTLADEIVKGLDRAGVVSKQFRVPDIPKNTTSLNVIKAFYNLAFKPSSSFFFFKS
jgi:hypothetical protein